MDSSPSTADHRMKKPAAQTGCERDPDVWPLSGKPYFYVILGSLHLTNKFRLTIPTHLSAKLPVSKIPAKIAYRGKVWDLFYLGNKGFGNCRLENRTWAKFAIQNNLQIGDVCVFELIEGCSNSASIKFKLQILKDEFPTELREKAAGSNEKNPISVD